MPADILIYALVAAGLVLWLRNILGTRHGDERERPNPFTSHPQEERLEKPVSPSKETEKTNLDLPDSDHAKELVLRNTAIENKTAENAIEDLAKVDKHFDLDHFLTGCQGAFTIIVEAFAQGDRETLKTLLSDNVYTTFDLAIVDREKRGETIETEIHAVKKAVITNVYLQDKMAYITVKFTAEETCVIRDKDDTILSGDPDRITEMVDIWTFGREIKSKDPRWLVYVTDDGEEEDHKTPVPDAS